MNRTILFRGKSIDTGEWEKGGLLCCEFDAADDGGYYHEAPVWAKEYFIVESFDGESLPSQDCIKVHPETVGQYTGLEDKNGKKIFEGDIVVCCKDTDGNQIDRLVERGWVEFKHGAFGLHRKHESGYYHIDAYYRPFKDWLEDYEYEVLGNIHDNLELMEGT